MTLPVGFRICRNGNPMSISTGTCASSGFAFRDWLFWKELRLKPLSKLILSVILASADLVAFAGSSILLLRFAFSISLSKFASTFVLAFPNLNSELILLTFVGPLCPSNFTTLIPTVFLCFLPLRFRAGLRVCCGKKHREIRKIQENQWTRKENEAKPMEKQGQPTKTGWKTKAKWGKCRKNNGKPMENKGKVRKRKENK